jgi:EmrB/QacA subfamily drug resistance transporter
MKETTSRKAAAAGLATPTTATSIAPSTAQSAALSIIVGIMLAMFLSALEQTIVAPALPTIGRRLGDIENLSWVVTAYLLAATASTPLFGKLSDIYGRRLMMLISLGVFIAGSVACALAPSMTALILGRALQGIGGGGILPLGQTVIADLLSPKERPLIQSYSSAMFLAASILGPVLGGALTDYVHWSLIFWINVPLGVAAVVMTDRSLRRLPRNERPHRLDMIGAALMVAAAIALLLALGWGGVRYRWSSPEILLLLGGSALLWGLFALRLVKAPEPFIPLTMLREPVVAGIVIAGFFGIGTVVGLSIFVPLYMELVLGLSPSAAGAALIAFMCGATLGSMLAGRLMSRIDRYKRVSILGLPIGIAALAAFAVWPDGLSLWVVAALLALAGAGIGPMYPTTTLIIQNAVPAHQFGVATGTLAFFRQLGGAIVVAVFGAIVLGGIDAGSGAHLTPAFRWVFIAAAVFLAIAFVAVLMIEEHPLRGPSMPPADSPPSSPPATAE